MKRPIGVVLALAGCLLLVSMAGVSCRTASRAAKDITQPAPFTEFFPSTFVSAIHLEKGNYPDLYSPDSFAVWVGSDVNAIRRAKAVEGGFTIDPRLDSAAERIQENFLVFECHVSSLIADMSIGYDVVGFRGMSAYLLTGEGRKIEPIQTIIGTPLEEQQVEALKKYGRANVIVFRKKDLVTGAPTIAANAPGVRLVIEGRGCTFYFEWQAAITTKAQWVATSEEYLKLMKTDFIDSTARLMGLIHTFD